MWIIYFRKLLRHAEVEVAVFPTARVIHRRIIRVNTCASQMHVVSTISITASIIRIATRYRLSQKIVHHGNGALKIWRAFREIFDLEFLWLAQATLNQLTKQETSKNTIEVVFCVKTWENSVWFIERRVRMSKLDKLLSLTRVKRFDYLYELLTQTLTSYFDKRSQSSRV